MEWATKKQHQRLREANIWWNIMRKKKMKTRHIRPRFYFFVDFVISHSKHSRTEFNHEKCEEFFFFFFFWINMNEIQSLQFRREQFKISNAIKKSNRLCFWCLCYPRTAVVNYKHLVTVKPLHDIQFKVNWKWNWDWDWNGKKNCGKCEENLFEKTIAKLIVNVVKEKEEKKCHQQLFRFIRPEHCAHWTVI